MGHPKLTKPKYNLTDSDPFKPYAPGKLEAINGKLIEDMHKQKTDDMNAYWKKFWKERFRNKQVQRTMKSMSKMDKYKYFAFPTYSP